MTTPDAPHHATVVASAHVACDEESADLPTVPGFVASRFNPLVRETVRRCLGEPGDEAQPNSLIGPYSDTTAIVLATVAGDATTSDRASQNLVSGRVHNPLLFFQSVTTSILGYLTIEYGLTGPVSCVAAHGGIAEEALTMSEALLAEYDVDQVLLIGAELAPNPRTALGYEHLAACGAAVSAPRHDAAVALLLRPMDSAGCGGREPARHAPAPRVPADHVTFGHLAPLVALAERAAGTAAVMKESR